jgi:UDP-N-acetylmuramyl pentapeptide phosphotransferase/UDP-N-acetylglucosamine-1-phosphate transferase
VSARRTFAALVVSAAAAAAARKLPEPALDGWTRQNYRDRPVSLSGGRSAAIGTLAGTLVSPALRRPALIAGLSALLAGAYDDLFAHAVERQSDKGLGGHLRALRSGRVSGGVVKVALIGAGSVSAAWLLPAGPRSRWIGPLGNAVLIAGTANLVNLFDLRPGRAAKVTLMISCVGIAAGEPGPMAAVAGASAAVLPDDLAERTMLGDLGANTLGAVLGVRLAGGSLPTRIAAGVAIAGLTLASERVSFTRVIASTMPLRWLDELGRLPAVAKVAPTPTPHQR